MKKAIRDATEAELNQMLRAYEGQVRAVRSTLTNDEFFDRQVAFLRKRIVQAQQELDELLRTREHGEEMIAQYELEMRKIRKSIKVVAHRSKIEKILELQRQVAELEAEATRCEAMLHVGGGRWERCKNERDDTEIVARPHGEGPQEPRPMALCSACAKRVREQKPGDSPWWHVKK